MDKSSKYVQCVGIAIAAIATSCGVAAAQTTISRSVGVAAGTAPDGSAAAFTFVAGGDGNLWLNIFSDEDYGSNNPTGSWSNQGRPSNGASISLGVGVTSGPLAFVLASDGDVHIRQWYNDSWLWANTFKPSGVTLTAGYGATHNGAGNPMAFLQGSDGNVWQDYWTGSGWAWYNLGHPSVTLNSFVGTVADGSGKPYVFFVGSDTNLWELYYNGSSWEWNNEGQPSGYAVTGPIGATTSGGDPWVFVNTSDGAYAFGCCWAWSNTRLGPIAAVTMPVGAGLLIAGPNSGMPYYEAFSQTALYDVQRVLVGETWSVNYTGEMPTSPKMPVGVLPVQNVNNAFAVGVDGNLWVELSYQTGEPTNEWHSLGTP